jgi:hypothetical protein
MRMAEPHNMAIDKRRIGYGRPFSTGLSALLRAERPAY